MYELKELEGYEFRTTEESKSSEDQIEIVNHMFVRNMNIARKHNPCLSLYKLVCTNPTSNEYSYVLKTDELDDDSKLADQTLEKLEYMLQMKQAYYNEGKRDASSPDAMSTEFLAEFDKYERNKEVQASVEASFVKFMQEEYELLILHKPKDPRIEDSDLKTQV